MGARESEDVRVSVAADVGGIELMHARLRARSVPPHIHDEYSISVTLRGGLGFDFRGSRLSAPSGVLSCVAPGEVHNAWAVRRGRWEFVNLLVPNAVVREVLASLEWREDLPDLPRRVVADPALAPRMLELYRVLAGAGDLLERQSRRTMVLADFFRRHSTARGAGRTARREDRAIERARELLHGAVAGPVPLARLSAHAGLSPYHFLRRFRAEVGMTPHVYLNQVRVLEARRRLAEGMSPAETALACGFCDQSHMSRQFGRFMLATPGQYQSAYGG